MSSHWSLLRPHAGRLVGVVALSGLAAAGESLGLALFSVLLNQVVESPRTGASMGFLGALHQLMSRSPHLFFLLLATTYIGKSLLTLLANWSAITVALKISDGWRLRLLRALMRVPLRSIPPRQGVALQLILDEPNIAGYGLASGGLLVQNLFSVATIYLTLAWLSPKTTAMLTAVALVAFLVLTQVFKYSRSVGRQRSAAFTEGFGYLTEMLSALRQVRLFGLENQVEGRASELVSRMRLIGRRSYALSSSPRIVIELVFVVVFVGVLAFLAPGMDQSALVTSSGLAAVAAMRLLPSFSAAAGIWVQLQQAFPAMDRIRTELDRVEKEAEDPSASGSTLPPLSSEILLRGVHFSYAGREAVLKGIDLRIGAGQFVAIVGPSGSGKSTIADLLCGVHEPDAGEVLVDGRDLRGAAKGAWRAQLGVVPQDAFLLSGTVRENLSILRPHCPEELLAQSVEAVGATKIVADLPKGYDTVVGERGLSLSGGQRQRLAIARVLVRQPSILLLDEATSALDAESDEMIFRNLESYAGKMTIIAIAHRLASVRHADRIYFLANGRVVEEGTHDELLSLGGAYAAYWTVSERRRDRNHSMENIAAAPLF